MSFAASPDLVTGFRSLRNFLPHVGTANDRDARRRWRRLRLDRRERRRPSFCVTFSSSGLRSASWMEPRCSARMSFSASGGVTSSVTARTTTGSFLSVEALWSMASTLTFWTTVSDSVSCAVAIGRDDVHPVARQQEAGDADDVVHAHADGAHVICRRPRRARCRRPGRQSAARAGSRPS